jgi:hypothetical protein
VQAELLAAETDLTVEQVQSLELSQHLAVVTAALAELQADQVLVLAAAAAMVVLVVLLE